jgi:TPR repeat protein
MYKNFNRRLMHIISFFILLLIIPCAHSDPNKTSFAELQKAADQGNARAQYYLGMSYGTGDGFIQDSTKSAEWYKKDADQGYAGAQLLLGWYYATGNGVTKDSTKSAEWYQKAADQGNVDAQSALKRLYSQ